MRSLDCIFKPNSIALIGASRQKHTIGHELLHNLISSEFNGKLFPVNPKAEVIHSIKCSPSIKAIKDEVDLAYIIVPKDVVLKVVKECGEKGVKGLVVISSGFKEVGGEGIENEKKLVELVRKYNMRMVGPNCMGIVNTHPDYNINGTFAPTAPIPGNIGFLSQSGAMGAAILNQTLELGLGISMFVSLGNQADVCGNEVLDYWENDPETKVILMYLESFGNPRKFTQVARRVTRKKPVIAVKSGRTKAGARAATSHTGALAGMDYAVDALFEQCGVIRVFSVEELFDLAMSFSREPIPRGNRVAIVSNAGGPAILATDACSTLGLKIAPFNPKMVERLRKALPGDISLGNPIDLTGGSGAREFRIALTEVLKSPELDAVIVIFVPPMMVDPLEVASTIANTVAQSDKTVVSCFMARDEVIDRTQEVLASGGRLFPVYRYPESAAEALSAMIQYKDYQSRPVGTSPRFSVRKSKAQKIIQSARSKGKTLLNILEASEILEAYGISIARFQIAHILPEALEFAWEVGFPVAMKVFSRELVHKSDIGGVLLDLRTAEEVRDAFNELMKRGKKAGGVEGIIVQEMVKGGQELIVGVTTDRNFGPLIMVGAGGIYVEFIKDVQFRINPITELDAREMIESLKAFRILQGVRGEKGVNIKAIQEVLLRTSQLIIDIPDIQEMDINPLIAFSGSLPCMALDARMKILN